MITVYFPIIPMFWFSCDFFKDLRLDVRSEYVYSKVFKPLLKFESAMISNITKTCGEFDNAIYVLWDFIVH